MATPQTIAYSSESHELQPQSAAVQLNYGRMQNLSRKRAVNGHRFRPLRLVANVTLCIAPAVAGSHFLLPSQPLAQDHPHPGERYGARYFCGSSSLAISRPRLAFSARRTAAKSSVANHSFMIRTGHRYHRVLLGRGEEEFRAASVRRQPKRQ